MLRGTAAHNADPPIRRDTAPFPFYLENDMSSEDSRYPYTYACDFIRSIAGYGDGGTKLSRSDASQIRSRIAEILGMKDDDLAKKIADHYLANRDEITDEAVQAFARFAKAQS